MSNPIEPKFPKRRFNSYFRKEMVAPDGRYLLPAGTVLTVEDLSWSVRDGWCMPLSCDVSREYAWTYARKLPEGQSNDDLPEQGAPEAEPLPRVDPRTQALAAEQRRVAQLREALHAVYENCRQNRNKGIGAGPLAMARTALTAAGVDLKAPLPSEGAPEITEPSQDSDCMRRLALTHFTSLLERIIPALIEHRQDLGPTGAASMAAEMARVAMEKAAAFAAEPSAPPTPEPYGSAHPDAPVLRMTHDGKVTTFGAIEAPAGCYLLPAGTELRLGDQCLKDTGTWGDIDSNTHTHIGSLTWATEQFCYARKLPPVERRADG